MGPPIRACTSLPLRPLLACLLTLLLAVCCGPASEHDAPTEATAATEIRRVICLVPALTETIVALGRADRLVAIGDFDPEVPGRPDLPRLGNAANISVESVVGLDPDLVLVNSAQGVAALAPVRSRIRVERIRNDRLDQVFESIEWLGRTLEAEVEAAALTTELRGALAEARRRAEDRRETPRVAVVVQRAPLYVAGGSSFVDDLLRAVGAENALGDVDESWLSISEETLVARAPDVILDASLQNVSGMTEEEALRRSWSGFDVIPAVHDDRVLLVRDDALFRAGPRLPEALEQLEAWLYPGEVDGDGTEEAR